MIRKREPVLNFDRALKHLGDGTTDLLPSQLGALSGASRSELAAFAETWSDLPVSRRQRASQMLVELAEENFKHDFNLLFRYMLNDEDAAVRAHAIDGLWEDEDTALVKPLIGYLRSDPTAAVRAAAADSLGRFVLLAEYDRLPQQGLADLIHDALLATVRSPNEEMNVRARALESLAYWSEDLMKGIIAAAYDDEDAVLRASAVCAMGRSADTYWRKTAEGELESPDARMRFEAARAAGELEDREAVPRLIELLEDADREVQGAAITALGQIGGKLARQALHSAATSEDEVLRSLADEALQELEFASGSDLLLLDLDANRPDEQDGDELLDDAAADDAEDDWDEDQDGDELEEEDEENDKLLEE
jgi:HEAT repeat protein